MEQEESCLCGAGDRIVMACSGASDVGLISDKVARTMQIAGKRKMSCLALVGAGIESSIAGFKTKDLLVIDGCPVACGKKMMEQHGFTNYKHLVITELGLKKGESPATNENIEMVFSKALSME
jgi:uncharacterized metal-binding protein